MSDKLTRLADLTRLMNKKAAKESPDRDGPVAFVAAGNEGLLDLGILATGNPAVDDALRGGFPRGTVVMIAGNEGVGKTCVAFDMIAHNQKVNPEFIALYVHLEARAFPLTAALAAGVDLERLVILNAQSSGEKTFDLMLNYLWNWESQAPRDLIDLTIIDSVAAAVPAAELETAKEEGLAKATVGRQAAMMSKALRILAGTGSLGKSTLLLIDQYRSDVGGYAGRVLPGGKAVQYYPKIIVEVTAPKSGYLKRGPATSQEIYGHTIQGRVSKNNTGIGRPHATFNYPVIYGEGVDLVGPLVEIAVRRGVIQQTSVAWFQLTYEETLIKFNGKAKIEERMRTDDAFLLEIATRVANGQVEDAEKSAPAAAAAD